MTRIERCLLEEATMSFDIRWICAVGVLLVGTTVFGDRSRLTAAPGTAPRHVVVVELFTSEGCSSCPPADDVLSQLAHRQPVAGVEVLALGEHVDYWDRLGWRDPFSSAMYSTRQSNYDAQVFHRHGVDTPHLDRDGQLERVGSDVSARSTSASVPVAPEWKVANLRIISFVQERASRRIVGAGAASGDPQRDTR